MLHAPHMDAHLQHVHEAGHDTAARLSQDLQTHARRKNLPDDLVEQLRVRYQPSTGEYIPGVKDPDFHSQMHSWEYGDGVRPPTGVLRTFMGTHEARAVDYFADAMFKRMGGDY